MKNRAGAHPHETPHHPHWPLAVVLFAFVFFLGLFSVHESSTGVHIKTGDKRHLLSPYNGRTHAVDL